MIEQYDSNYDDFTLKDLNSETLNGSLSPFTFICVSFLLVLFGLTFAYSSSYDFAIRSGLKHYHYLLEMAVYGFAGFLIGIAVICSPSKRVIAISRYLLPLSLLLLLASPFLQQATTGYMRYLLSSSFCSDFVLFSFILFVASAVPDFPIKERRGWYYIIFFLVALSILIFLTYVDETSYALLFLLVFIVVCQEAAIKKRYVFAFCMVGLTLSLLVTFSHPGLIENLFSRICYRNCDSSDAMSINTSLLAISEGGFWGKGIGKGVYKLGLIEDVHRDYVISCLFEEIGLCGFILLSLLFLLFILLGLRCSYRAGRLGNRYIRIASSGFTLMIILKALLSASVATGLLPLKGLPFPFFSAYGPCYFLTILECAFLYKFIHMTGRRSADE